MEHGVVGSLDSLAKKISNYGTAWSMGYYMLVFVYRAFVGTIMGEKVYSGEWMECSTKDPGCESMCFDEYSQPSMIRFWNYQFLAVLTPMALFYAYEHHCQQKANEEEERIKEEDEEAEKEYNRWNDETDEAGKFVPEVRKRVYKYKTKYDGDEKHDIVSHKWLRWAFILHLVLRLGIELFFCYLKIKLFTYEGNRPERDAYGPRPEDKIYELGPQYYVNMDVPGNYLCGKSPQRRTQAVADACAKDLRANGAVTCFVEFPREKTYYVRYMNTVDILCVLVTFIDILLCIKRMLLHSNVTFINYRSKKQENLTKDNRKFPYPELVELSSISGYHDNNDCPDNNGYLDSRGYQGPQNCSYHGSHRIRA